MNERLFLSLGEQLKHELLFVSFVSKPYYKPNSNHTIIDFRYLSRQYQLVLNGDIMLQTPREKVKIESFDDLIQSLIQSKKEKKSC